MLVVLEALPGIETMVHSPAAVQLMLGMMGADVVWFSTAAEASRFEVAAVALDLAEPTGRSIVHLGRSIELRTG